MEGQLTPRTGSTSYKEGKTGRILCPVTSVYTGEMELGKALEQPALCRAMMRPLPAKALTGQT